jgi:hypothetical protein
MAEKDITISSVISSRVTNVETVAISQQLE